MNHVMEQGAAAEAGAPRGVGERWGEALKALALFKGRAMVPGRRKVPFAELSSGGAAGPGVYGGSGGGWGGLSPGARYDYGAAAGELGENRVVAACVNAIAQALCDAPPYLEQRAGAGWARVETHPVIELLNAPNGYYGSPQLWSATAASECTAGEAFWRIEKSRAGLPAELWWEDARRFRALGNAEQFISGYRFQTERGGWVELGNDEVIHFRHALNPYNPRQGRTPLSAGLRQVALDNGIASYSGSILRNSGVMSLLISAKDATAGAQLGPGQIQEFVDKLKQRLFGEGAGGIAGLNLPIEMQKMSYSPDEMAVDKLTSYAEASICALLGVDPMVCGLGSGTQQKTYANMAEALNDFWERRIIPTKNRHSAELGAQLLPLYPDLANKDGVVTDYRIAWDYSRVAALQENEDEKHGRVQNDFKAGIIDLYDAQVALGKDSNDPVVQSYKGVFYTPPKAAATPGEDPDAPPVATKMLIGGWDESKHPRDDGRFGSGHNGAFDAAHTWKGDTVADESIRFQEAKAKAHATLRDMVGKKHAAAVVVELDGATSVQSGKHTYAPTDRAHAFMVTHADGRPPSMKEWQHFLVNDAQKQLHIVTDGTTYSFHKPDRYTSDVKLSDEVAFRRHEESVAQIYEQALNDAMGDADHAPEPMSRDDVFGLVSLEMSRRYGINCRVGKQN